MKLPLFLFLIFPVLVNAQEAPEGKIFKKLEKHALQTPEEIQRDLPKLTAYLIEPAGDDREKLWSIYSWITHHISYDEEAYRNEQKRINRNLGDILRRRQAVCFGYATLMKAMCERAEIPCEVISGYSKGTLTSEPDLDEPDHAWNAVFIQGRWALLDATWGSSIIHKTNDFVQKYKEGYFLTSPEKFIVNHLPADPMWQLLECPITGRDFQMSADSIRKLAENSLPCFNFRDSIRQFQSLSPPQKKLQEMVNTFRFNPSSENEKQMGYAFMDYAGILSDQAETIQRSNEVILDSLIALQDHIIAACRKATRHATLYNWQTELYANALINQAVALFQQAAETDGRETKAATYNRILDYLKESKGLLRQLPDSIYRNHTIKKCQKYIEIVEDNMKK